MTEWDCAIGDIWDVGYTYAHCRGVEEACVAATVISIKTSEPRSVTLEINPTWKSAYQVTLAKDEIHPVMGDVGYEWKVVCPFISSQPYVKVDICYRGEEAVPCSDYETQTACEAAGCYWYGGACHGIPEADGYDLPLYGSVTVLGHKFTNTRLMCVTAQAIIRPEGLAAKTLTVGGAGVIFAVGSLILPGSIVTTGVIMGGIYVALTSIDEGCTEATINIFNAAYTEDDRDTVVQIVTDETAGAFTPTQIEEAVTKAEAVVKNSKEEKKRQEDVKSGAKTPEQVETERETHIVDETMRILFEDNFTLSIPTLVMAGETTVSGTAPQQNQQLEICASKKLFGFDWLAADDVLATVTSDSEYGYEATLNLDEFGIIEVYARIPKDWWDILDKDITTAKHTVFVFTWEIIIFLIVAAALVYDKKTGKLGLLKRKR